MKEYIISLLKNCVYWTVLYICRHLWLDKKNELHNYIHTCTLINHIWRCLWLYSNVVQQTHPQMKHIPLQPQLVLNIPTKQTPISLCSTQHNQLQGRTNPTGLWKNIPLLALFGIVYSRPLALSTAQHIDYSQGWVLKDYIHTHTQNNTQHWSVISEGSCGYILTLFKGHVFKWSTFQVNSHQ
jgi:hypothetical protein